MTTYERVRRCVATAWNVDEAVLTPESAVHGGNGNCWRQPTPLRPLRSRSAAEPQEERPDSLEFVELVVCLEKEFGLELSDEEAFLMLKMTLGELVVEVDRLRCNRGDENSGGVARD
jgi:hypothetical protein